MKSEAVVREMTLVAIRERFDSGSWDSADLRWLYAKAEASTSSKVYCQVHTSQALICPICEGAKGGRKTATVHRAKLSEWGSLGGRPKGRHDGPEITIRNRAILETLYFAAIRVDELVSAQLADLNLDQRVLSVVDKDSKQRLVPLGRPAARALQVYLNVSRPLLDKPTRSPFLFIGRRGTKLTRQRVLQIINVKQA